MAERTRYQKEEYEMQRGQDHQPGNRVPTCNSAVDKMQDSNQWSSDRLCLVEIHGPNPLNPEQTLPRSYASTPIYYTFNTCYPIDFPNTQTLEGWVARPKEGRLEGIPVAGKSCLSPREEGVQAYPLHELWPGNYDLLNRWAINYPFFTGCAPHSDLGRFGILWDLNLSGALGMEDNIRRKHWPCISVGRWAVIASQTQVVQTTTLTLTTGIDVVTCAQVQVHKEPWMAGYWPTFWGIKTWERVSLGGDVLYTSQPNWPPSCVFRMAEAMREREDMLASPNRPRPPWSARQVAEYFEYPDEEQDQDNIED